MGTCIDFRKISVSRMSLKKKTHTHTRTIHLSVKKKNPKERFFSLPFHPPPPPPLFHQVVICIFFFHIFNFFLPIVQLHVRLLLFHEFGGHNSQTRLGKIQFCPQIIILKLIMTIRTALLSEKYCRRGSRRRG